jgi:hypothetical protein
LVRSVWRRSEDFGIAGYPECFGTAKNVEKGRSD